MSPLPQPWNQPPAADEPDGAWEREYDALLRRALGEGSVQPLGGAEERRAHPRFRLRPGHIGVQLETQFPVVNVSITGVCFRSAFALPVGQTLNLVLARTFLVAVQVEACASAPDEGLSHPDQAEVARLYPWRAHCRFTRASDGLRMLVMLNAMDDLVLGPHGT